MPRYIDADNIDYTVTMVGRDEYAGYRAVAFENDNDAMPTADVVPRAEVEEMIYKLECLLCHATGSKLSKHTYDLRTMETAVTDYINESYDEGYRDAKSEVAMEIFAEIDKIIEKHHSECYEYEESDECDTAITYISYISYDIDDLKKKYVEVKNDR